MFSPPRRRAATLLADAYAQADRCRSSLHCRVCRSTRAVAINENNQIIGDNCFQDCGLRRPSA